MDAFGLENAEKAIIDGGFDIITVHGLYGDRRTSWRYEDTLEELIFNDLEGEDCRVMNYGYDLLKGGNGIYARAGIVNEAGILLGQLAQARKTVPEGVFRTIVFVGHDIGGCIVKQALYLAGLDSNYHDIASCTKVVVLFGCPQRPLNGNHMEDMITHLAFSGSKVPPKNTVYHIRTLASAVMESCCSFIEAKTQLRAFLFAVFSKNDDPAQRIFDETTVTTDIGFGCRWGMVEPHASLTKAPKIGSVWALLHNFIDRIKTRFIDG